MDTTIVEAPNRREASVMNAGRRTAAVLSVTLSPPARNTALISSVDRRPPPTTSGMKISLAVRSTMSSRLLRPYSDATTSMKSSSSAPCS